MKLTLREIEKICTESIDVGFSSKLYQSYDSVAAYGALNVFAFAIANDVAPEGEETLAEMFDKIDFSLMPENFDMLEKFFNRAEEAKLKEFYSLRTTINEISNFDDEEFEKTMEQLKELQASESEVLGALKEII